MATATLSTCQLAGDPRKEPCEKKALTNGAFLFLVMFCPSVHPLSELLMRVGTQALQSKLLRAEAHSPTSEPSPSLLPPPRWAPCTAFKCKQQWDPVTQK